MISLHYYSVAGSNCGFGSTTEVYNYAGIVWQPKPLPPMMMARLSARPATYRYPVMGYEMRRPRQ